MSETTETTEERLTRERMTRIETQLKQLDDSIRGMRAEIAAMKARIIGRL